MFKQSKGFQSSVSQEKRDILTATEQYQCCIITVRKRYATLNYCTNKDWKTYNCVAMLTTAIFHNEISIQYKCETRLIMLMLYL